jgi:ribonuclease HI
MRKLNFYTDGSHMKRSTNVVSYGICLVDENNNKKYYTSSGKLDTSEFYRHYKMDISNPTAELYAAVKVLEMSRHLKDTEINITSDFNGVKFWLNGTWNPKKPYVKDLLKYANGYTKHMGKNGSSVKIHWVKGHSGVKYNEIADKLCQKPAHNNISEYINNIFESKEATMNFRKYNEEYRKLTTNITISIAAYYETYHKKTGKNVLKFDPFPKIEGWSIINFDGSYFTMKDDESLSTVSEDISNFNVKELLVALEFLELNKYER